MVSFKKEIEKKQQSHAYYQGAKACMDGLAMNTSPYDRGSGADSDWIDGYLDAMFLRSMK
jgi:hypothetical protein